jgi:hypothetical protein
MGYSGKGWRPDGERRRCRKKRGCDKEMGKIDASKGGLTAWSFSWAEIRTCAPLSHLGN